MSTFLKLIEINTHKESSIEIPETLEKVAYW